MHALTLLPSRGVLLTGGPGSGKTSLVLSLVESSCFGGEAGGGAGSTLAKLAGQLVGYHFCQVCPDVDICINVPLLPDVNVYICIILVFLFH